MDAYARRMNRACRERKEAGECREECIGIGWCKGCQDREKSRNDKGKRRGMRYNVKS